MPGVTRASLVAGGLITEISFSAAAAAHAAISDTQINFRMEAIIIRHRRRAQALRCIGFAGRAATFEVRP